jgi:hypothetical protein
MDQEALFNLIGKLYVDIVNAQRIIEALQKRLQEKEQRSSSDNS